MLRGLMAKLGEDPSPQDYERTLDLLERWLQRAAEKGPNSIKIFQINDLSWVVTAQHDRMRRSDEDTI